MTVLVTYAGRHGSTAGIAERVGAVLAGAALTPPSRTPPVIVRPAAETTDITGYSAVVLGSAVYMGRWLDPVRSFITTHEAALRTRPVWLFSVGLAPQRPGTMLADASTAVTTVDARDHQHFAGRMDRRLLGLAERAVIASIGTPDGDSRDWPAIEAWAARIATALHQPATSG